MSVSAVITLGYGQGVKFIPTLGFLAGTPAPPVIHTSTQIASGRRRHHLQERVEKPDNTAQQEALRRAMKQHVHDLFMPPPMVDDVSTVEERKKHYEHELMLIIALSS